MGKGLRATAHWLLALGIVFLFVSSWWMLALPLPGDEITFREIPFQLHKNVGITLVALLAMLISYRIRIQTKKQTAAKSPGWMTLGARIDYYGLYTLIVFCVVTGYLSSSYSGWSTRLWWLVDLPQWADENDELNLFFSDLHLWSCWGLLLFMVIHISAALFHGFSDDGALDDAFEEP